MRLLALLFFAALLGGACSLFANYDLEGLPCDLGAPPDQQCVSDAGFTCRRVDGGASLCTRAP